MAFPAPGIAGNHVGPPADPRRGGHYHARTQKRYPGGKDYHREHDMGNDGVETILRVKGSSSASALAAAISHGIYDSKHVVLRAIGAGAVNQAVKAVAIAQSYVGARGLVLSLRVGFTDVQMPDGKVTAIVMKVLSE
jgi:stage V sporulation protein S